MSNSKKQPKENIWNTILKECNTKNQFQNKNVLMLGNGNGGKRTLLNSLLDVSNTRIPLKKNDVQNSKLGMKDSKSILDFIYLKVQDLDDQDNDLQAHLRCYIVDEIEHLQLLDIMLDETFLQNMVLIINLDFEEPSLFMQQLSAWVDAFSKKLTNLTLSLQIQDQIRKKLKVYVTNYRDATFDEDQKLITHEINENLELQDGVLATSFGIPILITVNKSDLVDDYLKEKDGQQKLDYILYSLRNFAITYGASVFYISSKTKTNLKILYDYLLHRLYNFDLKEKAEVLARESIFIPSGFDSPNIIKQCFSVEQYKKYVYEDFIKVAEGKQKQVQKQELHVPDNQQFFADLKLKFEKEANGKADKKAEVNNMYNLLNMDDKNKKTGIDNIKIRQNVEAEIQNRLGYSSNNTGKIEAGGLNNIEAERILKILQTKKRENK